MLVPKGNTLLSPTSALSNMLPRHRSMTFQGSHQKWHRPAAIRTKISWWKPTTWQLHLHLVEDLDLRFPTRFLQLPPRCKEKGDLKGTKAKCSKKPLLNLFKWHRDGCFQKEKTYTKQGRFEVNGVFENPKCEHWRSHHLKAFQSQVWSCWAQCRDAQGDRNTQTRKEIMNTCNLINKSSRKVS